MSRAFATSTEHLLAEVARVDLLLAVHALAAAKPAQPGRVTTAEERIHALLDRAVSHAPEPSAAVVEARAEARRLAADIERRAAASARHGTPLRLRALAERFGLDRADLDLLLAALAPEVPGGATTSRPTIGVVLAALHPTTLAQLAARRRLTNDSPLLRRALVHLTGDARLPLPERALEIDPRVAAYLFGDDAVDRRLTPHVRFAPASIALDDLLLPADLKAGLLRLVEGAAAGDASPIVSMVGPTGAGKRSLAAALCSRAGRLLVTVDCDELLAAGDDAFATAVPLAVREALLAGAAIHWISGAAALAGARPGARAALLSALRDAPVLTFVSGAAAWDPAHALADRAFVEVEIARPGAADQARVWASALGSDGVSGVDLAVLTSTFRFTPGQIQAAAAAAKHLARFRDPAAQVTMADVMAACRASHGRRIASLARPVALRHGWDDLVLPADKKAVLRELCFHVRHRSKVMGEWGYDRKLGLGKGLSALLSGPPGTGKTMAAGVIAGELGVTLLHIDLSTVVSKYIGETEKHLAAMFESAEAANAALFFDEADALFGKRTEVKDAHDRYANLETSYLLQRIESYEGVVILATNFLKNVDDAFVRRLAFVVELPFPNAADRLRIWKGIWTPETPLDPDVDLRLLAERVELSGGYIRNIALAAAFLAADEGAPVAMKHLLHATRREFQKMGKVVDVGLFDARR